MEKKGNFEEPIRIVSKHPLMQKVAHDFIQEKAPEDAFFFCNLTEVIKKAEEWKSSFPRIRPYYAVKCNDDELVLRVLACLGTGFDCASKAEMAKVIGIGVDPKDIIFANPAKMASHIRAAVSNNVNVMTFDNANEIYKIKQLHPSAKLVVRIRCDAELAQCQLGMKFGVLPEEAQVLLGVARNLDMDVIGVSFHVGSGCMDPPVFQRAIRNAKWLFDVAKAEYGFDFKLLDIGGGFPGNTGTSIKEMADIVNNALSTYFPEGSGIDIIAEPGRFMVASSFYLLTQVHSIREVDNNNTEVDNNGPSDGSGKSFMYYINDGVYGSFNCVLYDHAVVHPETIRMDGKNGVLYPASIWGPTCDGLDQVCRDVMLPQMLIGEWLMFRDMGAYTIVAAGTFNGFPVPKVQYLVTEEAWTLLKQAPYFEPLIAPNVTALLKDGVTGGRDAVGWGCCSTSQSMPHPGNNGMVKLGTATQHSASPTIRVGVDLDVVIAKVNNDRDGNFNHGKIESALVVGSPGSGFELPLTQTYYKTDIPAQ